MSHMHIGSLFPKYYFSRYGLHEDDKLSSEIVLRASSRCLWSAPKSSRRAFEAYHRSAQKMVLNIRAHASPPRMLLIMLLNRRQLLSMFTTVTLLAQEVSMLSKVVTP